MHTNTDHKECCSTVTNQNSGGHTHHHDDGHDHGSGSSAYVAHITLLISLTILITMLGLQYGFGIQVKDPLNLFIFLTAYLLAGWNVLKLAFSKIKRLDIFNEFVLMSVATAGAFLIGEYSEGVAVMGFYSIGEWFQDAAVARARKSIKALLDIRPAEVTVIRNGAAETVNPAQVQINDVLRLKPGEKAALDGVLISESASFNTAALTGESKPDTRYTGETVLAGMISLNTVADVNVNALFKDSKLSRILEMVQDAAARKSQTQLFISKFAKIYTPIVFFLALAVCLLPYFFVADYSFSNWFYRSLVFLVISCPCALVVSIPLGYFGGIGFASRNGILFKGGNFLDVISQVDTVVSDKTGTLTKGVFNVQQVVAANGNAEELLTYVVALEKSSTHPVARAITNYAKGANENLDAQNVNEIAGYGLMGTVNGKNVLAGNIGLLKKQGIDYPPEAELIADTIVVVAIDRRYAGYIIIADEEKDDAARAIAALHRLNIKTVMLSGDKQSVVDRTAKALGINVAYGNLLPEDKIEKVQQLKNEGRKIAFIGDGLNDAPVLALADAGIAMGGLGSDIAIEVADIIIHNDQPSKIAAAIQIGKITRNIVWQNIILAMSVKLIVLLLGAGGLANLWEAVIADVGVALLAILNAVRIQHFKLRD